MRIRVALNFLIKVLYVGVNLLAFMFTDDLLSGNFKDYGVKWIQWARLNHSSAFNFFEGDIPKPGNVILPSFGLCEIQEAAMDVRHISFNKNKFICEISQNILYQYVLIVLWFLMVLSLIISVIGVILFCFGQLITRVCFIRGSDSSSRVGKVLTMRECEYLTYIRRKNLPLYGELVRYLLYTRHELKDLNGNIDEAPINDMMHGSSQKAMKFGPCPFQRL